MVACAEQVVGPIHQVRRPACYACCVWCAPRSAGLLWGAALEDGAKLHLATAHIPTTSSSSGSGSGAAPRFIAAAMPRPTYSHSNPLTPRGMAQECISTRASAKGNYTSVTIECHIESPEQVRALGGVGWGERAGRPDGRARCGSTACCVLALHPGLLVVLKPCARLVCGRHACGRLGCLLLPSYKCRLLQSTRPCARTRG